ncbi:MAG: hypothetical protein N3D20_00810 [Candidatus Pacearchaeota archaeon]|nr:hypothetical protein [Candidatus Pacearchaeota archaeon]
MKKAIIFDSGTIINFSMNGLLNIIEELKKTFNGYFLITEEIKNEIVNKPLTIKRFEFEAIRIEDIIDRKILELPYKIITKKELDKKTEEIFYLLNHSYYARGEFMKIVSKGEVSAIALSILLTEKGIDNVVAIDERTTRLLCENPQNLQKIFNNKLHTEVLMKRDVSFLKNIKIIRSSELVYVAYKKGLFRFKNNVLEALLYATKYKGCSISFEEIEKMKKL